MVFNLSNKKKIPNIVAGLNRTPLEQALMQLAALGITLAIALVGGWLIGMFYY